MLPSNRNLTDVRKRMRGFYVDKVYLNLSFIPQNIFITSIALFLDMSVSSCINDPHGETRNVPSV